LACALPAGGERRMRGAGDVVFMALVVSFSPWSSSSIYMTSPVASSGRKDNLVSEIAELDIKLTQTNEKIATLNKMAEVLINSKSEGSGSQKLARHEFSKLNMTESTTLEQVNEELLKLQQEFGNVLDEYEKTIRKLGQLFKVFDECINKEIMNEI